FLIITARSTVDKDRASARFTGSPTQPRPSPPLLPAHPRAWSDDDRPLCRRQTLLVLELHGPSFYDPRPCWKLL
uniref:Uncharacterized protein n=1 Tax=Leersia perrieri TaxID=77586 RepID=A0A0D9Y1C6_9ORYZ